jgi:hypothetical protein
MKTMSIVGAAVLLAACATHRVRCQGALQPINKPIAVVSGSKAAPESRP